MEESPIDSKTIIYALIEEKLLRAGKDAVYLTYQKKKFSADVLTDGSLKFMDQDYTTPGSCALAMKRISNPGLKADSGWLSLHSTESGLNLKELKDKLFTKKKYKHMKPLSRGKSMDNIPDIKKESSDIVKKRSLNTKSNLSTSRSSNSLKKAKLNQDGICSEACKVCRKDYKPEQMLLCDSCDGGYHMHCLNPPLESIPMGSWFCHFCMSNQEEKTMKFLRQLMKVIEANVEKDTQKVEKSMNSSLIADIRTDVDGTKEVNITYESNSCKDDPPADIQTLASTGTDTAESDKAQSNPSPYILESEIKVKEEPKGEKQINEKPNSALESPSNKIEEDSLIHNLHRLTDQLMKTLQDSEKKKDVLSNSTGEMLVHLANMDLPMAFSVVTEELKSIEECSKANPVGGATLSSGIDKEIRNPVNDDVTNNLMRAFDLRKRAVAGKSQLHQTLTALAVRNKMRTENCKKKFKDIEVARYSEENGRKLAKAMISEAATSMPPIQDRLSKEEELVKALRRRRQFVHELNACDGFVPAYISCLKEVLYSSDLLLESIIADKIRDLECSIREWDCMESHFSEMIDRLEEIVASNKISVKNAVDDTNTTSVLLPPSYRLAQRQLKYFYHNMDEIRLKKENAAEGLSCLKKAVVGNNMNTALQEYIRRVLNKCIPGGYGDQIEKSIQEYNGELPIKSEIESSPGTGFEHLEDETTDKSESMNTDMKKLLKN